jgi:hypothetical protein
MTWFKVDDNLAFHHKTVAAGVSAMGLWVRAGSWCAQTLTDGFVPEHMVPALADGDAGLAGRLVEAGLWRRVKGGFAFHEWSDRQPTRQSIEDRRTVRAAAGRNGGVRSGQVRRSKGSKREASASGGGEANAKQVLQDCLNPRPVGEGSVGLEGSSSKPKKNPTNDQNHLGGGFQGGERENDPSSEPPDSKPPRKRGSPDRGTRIPPDFAVTQTMVDWAREHTPHVDGRRETEQFIDYWQSKAGRDATKVDWVATWRNSMRRAEERALNRRNSGYKPTTDDKVSDWQRLKTSTDGATIYALPAGEAS